MMNSVIKNKPNVEIQKPTGTTVKVAVSDLNKPINAPAPPTRNEVHKIQGNIIGGTEESDEDESEDTESNHFVGNFEHSGKPATAPVVAETKKNEERKQPTNTQVPAKPKVDHIVNTETFQTIENNNELEIAVNNSYLSSEDDEEGEEDDEEDDIKELLDVIHQVENNQKQNLANNLLAYIDANCKAEKTSYQDLFRSEDIMNFDINTTKLFQLMFESSSKRNNNAVMNCKN